jgi:hypothetical protein
MEGAVPTEKPKDASKPAQAPTREVNTRPQKGGEAATTRFGMEESDNTDTPATGVDPDQQSAPPG